MELLFDLTYVVAVARAAQELRSALGTGHTGHALASYFVVFFGLWWAWVNSTWFASAYDTDDVPYRLLTMLQMVGVLVFAAGIPAAVSRYDFITVVVGYVIMRMALVAQVLRAAVGHPAGRPATVRYVVSVAMVQLCWIGWLALSGPGRVAGAAVLVAAELAVLTWSQLRNQGVPWHPGHIADRYGQFTIIVLGEVISAIGTAGEDAVSDKKASPGLLTVAGAGLLLVFAMWWSYFKHDAGREIRREMGQSLRLALLRALAHYLIFAAVAAFGAGLQLAIAPLTHGASISPAFAAFAIAIPVAVFVVALALLTARDAARPGAVWLSLLAAALVLAAAAATPVVTLPAAAMIMVALVILPLAHYLAKGTPEFAPQPESQAP